MTFFPWHSGHTFFFFSVIMISPEIGYSFFITEQRACNQPETPEQMPGSVVACVHFTGKQAHYQSRICGRRERTNIYRAQKRTLHADKGGDSTWRVWEPLIRGQFKYKHKATTTQW
jgi:hypothetical protein